jgi:hypothetical protein
MKKCVHQSVVETGRDEEQVPLGHRCEDCGMLMGLCDCVYENQGSADSLCRKCHGHGWTPKQKAAPKTARKRRR